jgi:uncharacterized RDD family membrane protein YckC
VIAGVQLALVLLPSSLSIVAITAGFLYNGLLDGGAAGQTIGKRALRIRVVDDATGGLLGPQRGLTRALLPLAFGVASILGDQTFAFAALASTLDGLWPLWDRRRQTWHDKSAGSVVVRVG